MSVLEHELGGGTSVGAATGPTGQLTGGLRADESANRGNSSDAQSDDGASILFFSEVGRAVSPKDGRRDRGSAPLHQSLGFLGDGTVTGMIRCCKRR